MTLPTPTTLAALGALAVCGALAWAAHRSAEVMRSVNHYPIDRP